jgi:ABC-2 type transport system permease protein
MTMLTIYFQTIRRQLGAILGWGLTLAVLGGYLMSFYDTMAGQQQQLTELIRQYPKELMVFFGNMEELFTPAGYLNTEFFSYMPIVLGFYALSFGAALLAGDEENGILDLLLAHPIRRAVFFFGRLFAYLDSLALILILTYIGFVVAAPGIDLEIDLLELVFPFLSMYALLVFFGMFALLLSMLLPAQRLASMVSLLVLFASFFVTALSRLDENLKTINKYSPMNYYQGGNALNGMEWGWFWGLIGLALLFALLAWLLFERRDIRVAGEGSWRIPLLSQKPR